MNKTGIFLLSLLALVIILCGCGKNDGRFVVVYREPHTFTVVVDTETGVEYFRQRNGGVCPLIDSYGNPYIYPAFDAREDALQGRSE